MKIKIFLSTLMVLLTSPAFTQTYTEIFECGWGQGRLFSISCFIDLDNDGLLDMIVGEQMGVLHHYEQDAVGSVSFTLVSDNFNGIEVFRYSAPCFIDLDNDGLLDMIVGKWDGSLNHYEQDAAGSVSFTLVSDNFSGIDVGDGSAPCFTDLNRDGLLDIIIGERDGSLFHYEQDAVGSASFTLASENFNSTDVGDYSTPCFTDLDSDGLLDMIVGEADGNLNHYEQDAVGSTIFNLVSVIFNEIEVGYNSAPCSADLDNDGLLDIIVGEADGNLNHYEQDAIGSASFTLASENFNGIDVGYGSTPFFTDLDSDGLLDMFVGEEDGNLNHYEQDAVESASFTLVSDNFNGIDVGHFSAPCFTDLDNDGLLDMIVGEWMGNLNHYEQDAVGSASFTLISDNFSGIDVGYDSAPSFTDLDSDGLLDMIVGEDYGRLIHYEQDAVGSVSFILISEEFNGIQVGDYSKPCFTEINGDGLVDLIIGENEGGIHYFQRNEASSVDEVQINHPSFELMQNYPNPFNASTTISFAIPNPTVISLKIYDHLGREIETLIEEYRQAGEFTVQWIAENLPSGIYLYRLEVGEHIETRKLVIQK